MKTFNNYAMGNFMKVFNNYAILKILGRCIEIRNRRIIFTKYLFGTF